MAQSSNTTTAEMSQVIPVTLDGDPRTFAERLAHWERAMVGQIARDVHAAGRKFIDWPISRQQFADENSVQLTVTVRTELR